MFKSVFDVIVIVASVLMEVELFRNLIIIRNNKGHDKAKVSLGRARALIVLVIVMYCIYGVVRNII